MCVVLDALCKLIPSLVTLSMACTNVNILVDFLHSLFCLQLKNLNPYRTAFPYGNGMVLHFYQQQESSTTKTVHKVINKGLKTYV